MLDDNSSAIAPTFQPVLLYDEQASKEAFAVYSALEREAKAHPDLRTNPLWVTFREIALARFQDAFWGEV